MSKLQNFVHTIAYFSIRVFFFPLQFLPYRAIHRLGQFLGTLAYYLAPSRLRKITYHNLALANHLNLSEKEIKRIARASFQNLLIIALEYFRLKGSQKKINEFVEGQNIEALCEHAKTGQGAIAVTGHIANWELCFLHFTQQFKACAIGKQIKNKHLYRFIQSIREMHGGEIIDMQQALSQGLKMLKQGKIFSMVNDQSFTSSFYSYPFLGARAWTSPSPALLAYRAKVPIYVVTTTRLKKGKYSYHISEPIWPDRTQPLKVDLARMMNEVMSQLETHVKKHPGQWLWQHKRWKQEGFHRVYKEYKADSILFILPQDPKLFKKINEGIEILSQIYRRSFLTFMVPNQFKKDFKLKNYECITYKNEEELLVRDYRFQLIFDFEENPKVKKHFMSMSAHQTYNLKHLLEKLTLKKEEPFDAKELFIKTLCLSNTPFH